MKMFPLKLSVILLLACSIVLGGCAAEKQQTRRYVWPRPPDQPRIEYIKSHYSQNDFPKSDLESFKEVIFGQPAPLSFAKPIDIKSNGKGIVYITDIQLAGIMVYDLNNQKVEFWAKGSDPDRNLGVTPYYLALDKDDNIYVVGSGAQIIYVLDSKGAVARKIDYSGQVKAVAGIAVDSALGRIYLVDNKDSKIAVFNLDGTFQFSFGAPGEQDGEFNRPSPITLNRKGEVVIGDVMNARVQIFSSDGKFLRKFGRRGTTGPDLQIIKGVAVDSDDNVYVTDGKANQIKIFTTMGDYLLTIGAAHSVTKTLQEAPGGFLLPQGIHIDATDTIYVVDQANTRFQVLKYLPDAGGKAPEEKTLPAK